MPISPLTRSVRLDGAMADSKTLDLLDRVPAWPQPSEPSLSDSTDKRVDGEAKQDDEVQDDSPDAAVDARVVVAPQAVIVPLTLKLASNVAAEASAPELTAPVTTPHNSDLSKAVSAQPLVNNAAAQRKASLASLPATTATTATTAVRVGEAGASVAQAASVSRKLATATATATATAAPGRLDKGEPLLTRDRNAAEPVASHLTSSQGSEAASMVGEDAAPAQGAAGQAEGNASAEPEAGKTAHPHAPLPHEESTAGKKAETAPSLPQRSTSLFSAAKPILGFQPAPVAVPQTEMVYSFQSWGQGHQVTAQLSAAGTLLIPSSPKVESALQLANAGIPSDERWTLAEQGEQQERKRDSGHMSEQEEEHD